MPIASTLVCTRANHNATVAVASTEEDDVGGVGAADERSATPDDHDVDAHHEDRHADPDQHPVQDVAVEPSGAAAGPHAVSVRPSAARRQDTGRTPAVGLATPRARPVVNRRVASR